MKLGFASVVLAGTIVACGTESTSKYVDVNGDGVADIEYTAEASFVDLNEEDMITVEGTTVTNAETQEEWVIADETALENSFENIGADLKEFSNDVEQGVEDAASDMKEGAQKVGEDIEQGLKATGDAIEDGAHEAGEALEKAGENVQEATDGDNQ